MPQSMVTVAKSINAIFATTNMVYYKFLPAGGEQCYVQFDVDTGQKNLFGKKTTPYVKLARQFSHPEIKDGHLYLNSEDRIAIGAAIDDKISINIIPKPAAAKTVIVSLNDKSKTTEMKEINEEMELTFKNIILHTVVNRNSFSGFKIGSSTFYGKIISVIDYNNKEVAFGSIDESSEIIFMNTETKTLKFNLSSINFEKVGVGGLEKEFMELMKSIFITRIIPDKIYKKLNIKHTKGAILYGPPGCGKTRIARQIGSLIGCKNIKVVNGPEIFNKYVGDSEKNIRDCFEDAKKNPDELHLLIFDEFDAIASRRSGSGNNDISNKVVGQLLTMLDGVDEMNNIIVFALTNRLDIIDPAVLRPGRFSFHVKIDLPDLNGRYEILKIHSKDLIENSFFEPGLDLIKIAELTDSFTGAELEYLVQKTVHEVLGSKIDFNNITESAKKIDNLTISMRDFLISIDKINPMFKNKNKIVTELQSKIKKKLNESDINLVSDLIDFIKNKNYPVVTCIAGQPKSGKTSIVCDIGTKIGVENVEYVSGSTISKLNEREKINYFTELFARETSNLIILDNIELIIEFVSDVIFNRNILHELKILLGETTHHVIITTSYYHELKRMTILDSVESLFSISDYFNLS